MNALQVLQKNVHTLSNRAFLEKMVIDAVVQTQKIAISLQKQQLSEGEDSNENIIGKYKRSTELESLFGSPRPIRPKKEGQPYNFEWQGGFFEGMTLLFDDKKVEWWSTDEKTPFLVSKYKDLLGLNTYNFNNYGNNAVFPILEKQAWKILKRE